MSFDTTMPLQADVLVVGAGAAGLATAIFTARRNPQQTIVALDGAKKLGAKILVSGGGRCNVTNRAVTEVDFWGGSRNVVRRILRAFSADQAVEFFRELGVTLHEEEHGKLFPDTHSARTVLDALLGEAARLRVRILPGHRVTNVEQGEGHFFVTTQCSTVTPGAPPMQTFRTSKLVLATGGLSLPKTGSDGTGYRFAQSLGHSLVPTTPALAPLILDGDFHVPLSGIAHEVELTLKSDCGERGKEATERRSDEATKEVSTDRRFGVSAFSPIHLRGAMLWTHFGISGPVVLDMSRSWHNARLNSLPVRLSANFLPGDTLESAERKLLELGRSQPKTHLHNALSTLLPARISQAILHRLDIPSDTPLAHLARDHRRKLLHALFDWPLPVRDSRGYAVAEVTAGGVPLDEINPSTMESRKSPGLYFVGEILDVDGRIGGFNFQWAWSTAHVAALALASRGL